jgi:acyl dehydratase/AcrR family transcriptional regulator
VPKIVDHDQRRDELADAALRLIARNGVSAVTVRDVAEESGWSTGVLAHYYGDKYAVLAGGLRRALARAADNLADAVADPDPWRGLRRVLEEILPLDVERLALARIYTAFMGEALADEQFRTHLLRNHRAWQATIVEAVKRGRIEGAFETATDVDQLADTLSALVEGLRLQALLLPELTADEQRRRLEGWLDALVRRSATVPVVAGKYFEELEIGMVFEHQPSRTVTETDNLLFSTMSMNPQPLHVDAEFARNSQFGQILVNSMFTLATVIGLSVGETTLGTTVGNLGFEETRFPNPVFIGDTITASTEVTAMRESKSRPEWGIVTFTHRGTNQRGEVVCTCVRNGMIVKRSSLAGS